MRYKEFHIQKVHSQFNKKKKDGETVPHYGYRCYVYWRDEPDRKFPIEIFDIIEGRDYHFEDEDSEILAIVRYMDKHYRDLVIRTGRPDHDEIYALLTRVCAWIDGYVQDDNFFEMLDAIGIDYDSFMHLVIEGSDETENDKEEDC